MKIIEITSQHRRDFYAIAECENCKAKDSISGYDDRYYHDNVMPNMKCPECGKTRIDLGLTQEPTQTKYQEWEVI